MDNNKNDSIISVIVPVYNCRKYLMQCVKSICNQTYNNIELILVDDGSSDGSEILCEDLKNQDSRIKVIHKKNEGVSAARNDGIEACCGDYVTFVDSDDFIAPGYCEYLLHLCKSNGADISLTPQPLRVQTNDRVKTESDEKDNIELWNGLEAARNMLYYKIVISSWNKMYSKRLLDRYNIRFKENLSYGEGFQFVINCFIHSNIVASGKRMLYCYRVDNNNSVMTNFKEKLVYGSFESLDNIKKLVSTYTELKPAIDYAYWHTSCDCLNTIIGCEVKEEQTDLYEKLYRQCREYALKAIKSPISRKEKLKAILYFISPGLAANIINTLRKRKFTKV